MSEYSARLGLVVYSDKVLGRMGWARKSSWKLDFLGR